MDLIEENANFDNFYKNILDKQQIEEMELKEG